MRTFKTFFNKIKTFFSNIRVKITSYMFIPVILLSIGLYIFVLTNIEQNKENVQTNYTYTMQSLARQSESDIESIINFIESYSNNEETINLLNQSNPDTSTAINIVSKINKELCSRFYIVDSVFLYNQNSNFCVTSAEAIDSPTFFKNIYVYDDYKYSYWKNYRYLYSSISQHQSLSPSLVTVNGQSKYIQPLVFLQINDVNIKNFLIINISFEKIIAKANSNYNPEEKILILNNASGDTFDATTSTTTNILNTDLYKFLLQNDTSFDYTHNSKKYFVVSHSNTKTISGYTYYSLIPYKTLYAIQIRSFFALFSLLCFLILSTILITLKISKLVASPLENIITHSKQHSKIQNESIFRTINTSIDNIFAKTENYNKLLPYIHEKYIIDFLNSSENSKETKTQELLASTLPFDFEYFSAVIIQLYPLASFYTEYDSVETENIQVGFYSIVKELFMKELKTYIINSEKNTLYIIVNSQTPEEDSLKINTILNQINDLLSQDLSHVALMFGVGTFYAELKGLKKSHIEALNLFNSAPRSQPEVIIAPSNKRNKKGLLSYKFENGFSNALNTYDYETAISMFNDIIKKNESLNEKDLKNLYSQILHIISKILMQKNISSENSIDYKSISNILDKPINEIRNEILILLSEFKADYNLQNPTAMNIIAYLQNNYHNPELSLDNIATTFSISKTYVSSILKNHLGITFKEYLTSVRIDEAKKLLSTTDIPILDVVEMTGFSNKQTFSRVFKSTTNMTALEYRKKHK